MPMLVMISNIEKTWTPRSTSALVRSPWIVYISDAKTVMGSMMESDKTLTATFLKELIPIIGDCIVGTSKLRLSAISKPAPWSRFCVTIRKRWYAFRAARLPAFRWSSTTPLERNDNCTVSSLNESSTQKQSCTFDKIFANIHQRYQLAGGTGKYDSLRLPSIKHYQRPKRAISEYLCSKPRLSHTRIGFMFPLRFLSSGTSRNIHFGCVFGRYIRWTVTSLAVRNDKIFRHKLTTSMLEAWTSQV